MGYVYQAGLTGDTGAKIASGNGATVENGMAALGVQVLIQLGAVSGTTPTCTFKLQGSVDGTIFYDIPGAATASLATAQANSKYGITVYPAIAVTAGSTTSNTSAGASGVISKYWRVVWTIAGTTPSFTITQIDYLHLN